MHKGILDQIYAVDINPFPLHLTATNLATRYIKAPSSEMNTILSDFFRIAPAQKFIAPYTIKTPAGEIKREISIPRFDAVIANPPYTRWTEISNRTKDAITATISEKLKEYEITGGIGNETGIYVHFIMYAHEFLRENGRLGMIISNSWLQSDYGAHFVNFLLDHFKVKAVIDFNQRLFRIPLVATCILLLEKEKDAKKRSLNQTVFLYVDKEANVEEILDAIENPQSWKDIFLINVVKQSKLPRNEKWIKELFKTTDIQEKIVNLPSITKVEKLLQPRYGNIEGVSARGGTGADKFFYLTKKGVGKWNLTKAYLYKLLSSPRYSRFFTFTKKNWRKLEETRKSCYVFICHKPRNKLPRNVKEFIKWGETTSLVRVREGEEPKTANESTASKAREKSSNFYGWYDLGSVEHAQMYTLRRAQYYHRFILSLLPVAFDDSLITLIPKPEIKIPDEGFKTLLTYLNSSFSRFFIETYGRPTGGGVIELDVNSTAKLPILNINKLKRKE